MLRTIADAGNASQSMQWAILAVELGFNGLMAAAIWALNSNQRKRYREQDAKDRLNDHEKKELKRRVDEFEATTHSLTAKLVDERIRAMTHDVATEMQGLKSTLQLVNKDLEEGQQTFRKIFDSAHELEITNLQRAETIKEYVRDTCVARSAMEKFERATEARTGKLEERVQQLGEDVAGAGIKRGDRK
jgi:hypothetical protein